MINFLTLQRGVLLQLLLLAPFVLHLHPRRVLRNSVSLTRLSNFLVVEEISSRVRVSSNFLTASVSTNFFCFFLQACRQPETHTRSQSLVSYSKWDKKWLTETLDFLTINSLSYVWGVTFFAGLILSRRDGLI